MTFHFGWKTFAAIAAFSGIGACARAMTDNPWGAAFSAFCAGLLASTAMDLFEKRKADRAVRVDEPIVIHANAAEFVEGMRRARRNGGGI